MKLLVCGGRTFAQTNFDIDFLIDSLCDFHEAYSISFMIAGGAKGTDTMAIEWAKEMNIPHKEYLADWNRYGRSAGGIRNRQMLDEGKPNAVYAFIGGRGTADMIRQAEGRGIDVYASSKVLFNSRSTDYRFLSNFATGFDFHDADGVYYPTSEHYYQAMKAVLEKDRSMIQMLKSALEAKNAGKSVLTYTDWYSRKFNVMRDAIKLKFVPDTEAAELLMSTNNDYLVEFAPWGDTVWGVDKMHIGQNHMGKILMNHRSTLFRH